MLRLITEWIGLTRDINGFLVAYHGTPITWGSKQQPVVALSTCEAEYMSMALTSTHLMYIRQIAIDIEYAEILRPRPIMYCDNRASEMMANSRLNTKRSKHIDVRFHFIREVIIEGKMCVICLNQNKMYQTC